jgi:hypothetical protein
MKHFKLSRYQATYDYRTGNFACFWAIGLEIIGPLICKTTGLSIIGLNNPEIGLSIIGHMKNLSMTTSNIHIYIVHIRRP